MIGYDDVSQEHYVTCWWFYAKWMIMFFKVCIAGYSVTASNASELKYYFGRLVMTKITSKLTWIDVKPLSFVRRKKRCLRDVWNFARCMKINKHTSIFPIKQSVHTALDCSHIKPHWVTDSAAQKLFKVDWFITQDQVSSYVISLEYTDNVSVL